MLGQHAKFKMTVDTYPAREIRASGLEVDQTNRNFMWLFSNTMRRRGSVSFANNRSDSVGMFRQVGVASFFNAY